MSEQRSEEWFADRAGKITGSMMHAVMAFTANEGVWKSGPRKGQQKVATPLKARTDYKFQLAAERLTHKPKKGPSGKALEHGRNMEPEAIAAYERRTGQIVEEAGFILHPDFDFIGASPDFLVGDDGGGECKCPQDQDVHLATLQNGLPSEHIEQIQGGLWVTGRKWWDFVSYHEDFPEHRRLYVQRVHRDDVYIAKLEAACLSLEAEVRVIVREMLEPLKEAA